MHSTIVASFSVIVYLLIVSIEPIDAGLISEQFVTSDLQPTAQDRTVSLLSQPEIASDSIVRPSSNHAKIIHNRQTAVFSSLMSRAGSNNCVLGSATRDLCERCAKVAKNEIAFPLCCSNSEQVRDWCEEFLSFSLA
jgi:hypothetical protein